MQTRVRGNGHKNSALHRAQPVVVERTGETQRYGELIKYPIGLSSEVCATSVELLNQTLADTVVIRDMYKKHHWQTSGPTFYQLHLLFDKHYEEQSKLVDLLAERVQMLGGIAVAMAHDIVDMSQIERPPRGREESPVQISRLLDAHEMILRDARAGAKKTREDEGTNDLFVSEVIRTNEMQVWFLAEHLVATDGRQPR